MYVYPTINDVEVCKINSSGRAHLGESGGAAFQPMNSDLLLTSQTHLWFLSQQALHLFSLSLSCHLYINVFFRCVWRNSEFSVCMIKLNKKISPQILLIWLKIQKCLGNCEWHIFLQQSKSTKSSGGDSCTLSGNNNNNNNNRNYKPWRRTSCCLLCGFLQ